MIYLSVAWKIIGIMDQLQMKQIQWLRVCNEVWEPLDDVVKSNGDNGDGYELRLLYYEIQLKSCRKKQNLLWLFF